MAIPFYENEDETQQQQQQTSLQPPQEVDQVDGPALGSQNASTTGYNPQFVEPPNQPANQSNTTNANDLEAWKILALAMCKALKDFYQQNMSQTSSTAVIQILPNGQVKPKWN